MSADNGYPYLLNGLIALDQFFNSVLRGACDETLSSRTYRMARIKGGNWGRFERIVNALFWRDVDSTGRLHCELSYWVEMHQGHMPKVMVRATLLTA